MFNPIEPEDIREHRRLWTAMLLHHIVNLHKGRVPGIRSSAADFTRHVAELPTPRSCGLTQAHVDAMEGLADLALGQGNKQERRDFVQNAFAKTPTIHMPQLGEGYPPEWLNMTWLREGPPDDLKPRPRRPPPGQEGAGGDVKGTANAGTIGWGSEAARPRPAANRASVMMGSYTIMILGLLLLAVTLFVFRRGRRNTKPRRRFRVWDVV